MFDLVTRTPVTTYEETRVELTLAGYIGAKISAAREARGERVAQFVRNLKQEIDFEVSETTIHKLEKGETQIRLEDLYEIASYFEMDMGEFIPSDALFPRRNKFEASKAIKEELETTE